MSAPLDDFGALADELETRFGFGPWPCPSCDASASIFYDGIDGRYVRSCACSLDQIRAALRAASAEDVTAPPRCESPPSSSLKPLAKPGEEPEIEQLLRLHQKGKFETVAVELPGLPGDATTTMATVRDFYALVLGLRRAAGMDMADEVPFAGEWVAGWTGVPRRTVARAIRQLGAAGVLVDAGELRPRKGKVRGTRLWGPGRVGAQVLEFPSRRAAGGAA